MSDDPTGGFSPVAPPPAARQGATLDTGGFSPVAKTAAAAPSFVDTMWSMVTAPTRFASGVTEGLAGGGIPKGLGSEQSVTEGGLRGGREGMGGSIVGTGVKSAVNSMWDMVAAPGKAATGELGPPGGPQMQDAARGLAMATAGVGGFRPGMRPPPPPLAEAPVRPPQLLLPPPTIGVAGQPATATGQIGTPGAFRAGLEAGGRTLGDAPPPPPPFGGTPSPWRERMEAGGTRTLQEANQGLAPQAERLGLGGAPRVLPPGPQPGMLPPGPASVMTHPSATPVGMPPPIRPQTPPPPPVRPAPPTTPQADTATVNYYRNAVRPGGLKPSKANNRLFEEQNKDILRGVDRIIDNQPNLRLTAPNGMELPPGSTVPTTMKQMNEAMEQSEATLFQQWDPMTRRAGERGLHIDLAPVVSELRALAKNPKVADVNLGMPEQMEKYAAAYEARGSYTPLETQEVIREINRKYESGEVSKSILEPIARILRKQMDETITKAEGPGWQRLRDDYGALRAMDKDVTRAVERIARKPNSGLAQLGDLISSSEFIHGLITLNPAALSRAVGMRGANELHRLFNDPNRIIERMFKDRIASRTPRPPPRSPLLSLGTRSLGMSYGLSQPPSGGFPQPDSGTEIGRRSVRRPVQDQASP